MIYIYGTMKNICSIVLLILALNLNAQDSVKTGLLQLGTRTTVSAFGDEGFTGLGVGGQFRIGLGERLNTEWFADYITTDLDGLGQRIDNHIGWSVMYYPLNTIFSKGKVIPYILAGHCFDYTKVKVANQPERNVGRWSSAVQAGAGTHIMLADNFDFSLSAQFMQHLGKDIEAKVIDHPTSEGEYLYLSTEQAGLEGHVLFTAGLNINIAHIWKSKK